MRRVLAWHVPSTITATAAGRKLPTNLKVYNALGKPGTKTCDEFNPNKCFKGHEHPELQHVHMCSFCLVTINRVYLHSENSCKHKEATLGKDLLTGVVPVPSSPTYS